MVVSPPNINQRTVSFSLPPTHVDKYFDTYWQLTPAQLQLVRDNTPWKQSPVAKKWMERSCSKVHQITLPAALHNNRFSLLADDKDDDIDDDEEPTTATAYSVLDHDTGETLEHRQLRRLPKYKATWDKSYADEIGRLCQGVGQHTSKPNTQRVAGTDTMKPIKFNDIPFDRQGDVAHTRVVCKVRPTKEDPN